MHFKDSRNVLGHQRERGRRAAKRGVRLPTSSFNNSDAWGGHLGGGDWEDGGWGD